MADSPFIFDVTRENFPQALERSFEIPLLLDFWAGWCQPCQALMPILARLADEYRGRFLLGKLNTEEEQEIAAQFGIRSIPTVKLFRDGRPVDEFMGALPESAIREFLDRHVPRESDATVEAARERLHAGDSDGAIALLEETRRADPDNPRVTLALAESQAAAGNVADAGATLDTLPPGEQGNPEVVALRSRLYFEGEVADAPAMVELEASLAANPDDLRTLLQLALRKVVDRDYETAMDLLLKLMQTDRDFEDDAGRRGLLRVFDLLGDDPRVGPYRRRMASLLH